MARKNYKVDEVIRALSNKQGCNINLFNKTITIDKNHNTIGNGSWGKIDFLTKTQGFIQFYRN